MIQIGKIRLARAGEVPTHYAQDDIPKGAPVVDPEQKEFEREIVPMLEGARKAALERAFPLMEVRRVPVRSESPRTPRPVHITIEEHSTTYGSVFTPLAWLAIIVIVAWLGFVSVRTWQAYEYYQQTRASAVTEGI